MSVQSVKVMDEIYNSITARLRALEADMCEGKSETDQELVTSVISGVIEILNQEIN